MLDFENLSKEEAFKVAMDSLDYRLALYGSMITRGNERMEEMEPFDIEYDEVQLLVNEAYQQTHNVVQAMSFITIELQKLEEVD